MIWDGLDFFVTDFSKLGRLKGKKVDFSTPLTSPNDMLKLLASLSIGLYFIFTQFNQLDTLKTQTVTMQQIDSFLYDY